MFYSVDHIAFQVERLLELAREFNRGDTIAWAAIEAITGPRYEGRARYVINKWRRRLEHHRQIVTLASRTVGVRLLTHHNTAVEIPRLRQRKAYRQVRKALAQCKTVDESRLSLHERKLFAAQRENMAQQRRELFRSQKQSRIGAATEVNPRRKLCG